MKFLKKLKAALKAKGLSEELADFINIDSEDQIEEVIEKLQTQDDDGELDFNKILASKEFTEFVNKNGLEKVLSNSKALQAGFDKKVTKGINTFKKKFLKDELEEDEEDDDLKGKKGDDDDMPSWAKKMNEKMESIISGNKKSKTMDEAKELFSKSKTLKKLPEKIQNRYLNSIELDSDTSLEDQIKEFEAEAGELKLGSTSRSGGLPMGDDIDDSKATEKEVEDVVGDLL